MSVTGQWTYGGDPENSPLDQVRLFIGDTAENDPQLSDSEIRYIIGQNGGNTRYAAIACARLLWARYTRLADEVTGEIEVKWSQRARAYKDLIDDLENDLVAGLTNIPMPFAGGISKTDYKNRACDPDRIPDSFQVGETNNPRSGYQGREYYPPGLGGKNNGCCD